jgi:hypothetical protein
METGPVSAEIEADFRPGPKNFDILQKFPICREKWGNIVQIIPKLV